MDKVKEELLKDLKRSNKTRKLKLANKYGFSTVEEYETYLLEVDVNKAIKSWVPVEKPTIHNIIILDKSGSMDGPKFTNSIKGIRKELEYMNNDSTINWTLTFIPFSGSLRDSPDICFMNSSFNDSILKGLYANGSTPLYKVLNSCLTRLKLSSTTPNDKFLIKIYTDGGDTDGGLNELKETVKLLDKNKFTITFVGTPSDVNNCVQNIGLDESNTLALDSNDGKGFERAFEASFSATQAYTTKVINNEDVSTGFYKQVINK